MLGENLGGKADSLVRLNAAVGPHLQGQLVIVGDLAHAGIGHRVVDLADGGEDGVDRNDPDGHVGILVLFRAHVSAALVDGQRHLQVGILVEGGNVHVRIQNLDLRIGDDVAGRQDAGAYAADRHGLRLLGIHARRQTLQVQQNLRHILGYTGNRGKLVKHTVNFDRADRHARQHAQQNAP